MYIEPYERASDGRLSSRKFTGNREGIRAKKNFFRSHFVSIDLQSPWTAAACDCGDGRMGEDPYTARLSSTRKPVDVI